MRTERAAASRFGLGVIVALLVNYFLPRERVVACWEKVKGLFRPLEHS